MTQKNIKVNKIFVQLGFTTVGEFLRAGYTISDFKQILDEPTIATCNLMKDDKIIAVLSFYHLKEEITIDELKYVPIDFVLLFKKKDKKLTSKQSILKRIILTALIHGCSALLFFIIYVIPSFFSWVQNSGRYRSWGRNAGIGVVLLILPALIITFLWSGSDKVELSGGKKLLLSLFLIINVIISITYLVLIDNSFTHRFF